MRHCPGDVNDAEQHEYISLQCCDENVQSHKDGGRDEESERQKRERYLLAGEHIPKQTNRQGERS